MISIECAKRGKISLQRKPYKILLQEEAFFRWQRHWLIAPLWYLPILALVIDRTLGWDFPIFGIGIAITYLPYIAFSILAYRHAKKKGFDYIHRMVWWLPLVLSAIIFLFGMLITLLICLFASECRISNSAIFNVTAFLVIFFSYFYVAIYHFMTFILGKRHISKLQENAQP